MQGYLGEFEIAKESSLWRRTMVLDYSSGELTKKSDSPSASADAICYRLEKDGSRCMLGVGRDLRLPRIGRLGSIPTPRSGGGGFRAPSGS